MKEGNRNVSFFMSNYNFLFKNLLTSYDNSDILETFVKTWF